MGHDLRSITQVGTSEPFELQVSRGQIPGHTARNIFGTATAIGTTFLTPWELANTAALPFLSAQSQLTLSSSSASDTAVSILINGLDDNYKAVSEVVALNGLTGVTTTKESKFINDCVQIFYAGNGSRAINLGNSWCYQKRPQSTVARITANKGQTLKGVFILCLLGTFAYYIAGRI